MNPNQSAGFPPPNLSAPNFNKANNVPTINYGTQGVPQMQGSPEGPAALPPYPYPYALPPGHAPAAPGVAPMAPAAAPSRKPFAATKADGALAIACLVVGFLFMRWGAFNSFEGWGVAVVASLWLVVVLVYGRTHGKKAGLDGVFWVIVTALTGLSCVLWPGAPWHPLRGLLLLFAALYGAAVVLQVLMKGRTGNLLFFDGINLLFALPFQNLGYPFAGLRALPGEKGERKRGGRRVLSVLAGLVIGGILLAIIIPMLAQADSGNFGRVLGGFSEWLSRIKFLEGEQVALTIGQLVLGIPVAIWLCGLIAGAAHGRYSRNIDANGVEKGLARMRFLPGATLMVVLILASAAYALFIGCQIPYFFSALGGAVPEGYEVYAEYAREGFFELCRIAAINLGVLAVGNGLYRGRARASKGLRALNIILSALTLLIILTAWSKMALYISVYGLTPGRVLTCVFMAFLAGICVGVICLQFFRFSIVRVGLVLGAGLLCALCLVDTGGMIVRYNADRYLSGTLMEFDEGVLYFCGPSGAEAGMEVYEMLDSKPGSPEEEEAKERLRYVLSEQEAEAAERAGTAADTLALARVRRLGLPDRNKYNVVEGEQLFWERQWEIERMGA